MSIETMYTLKIVFTHDIAITMRSTDPIIDLFNAIRDEMKKESRVMHITNVTDETLINPSEIISVTYIKE